MISDHVKEDIRSRIDIVDLVGAYVSLKKKGGQFWACCPFHHEKTPSFSVNSAKQFYHCFGCGEHGDIFTFLMKMEGLSFGDALRKLAERVGVPIEEKKDPNAILRNRLFALHAELAEFYQRCLKTLPSAQIARDYLVARKLDGEIVERFGIGYAPVSKSGNVLLKWAEKHKYTVEELIEAGIALPPKYESRPNDFYDPFKGRLMFPIRDAQGRVVAFSGRILVKKDNIGKYVNSRESEIFKKGRILYALDQAARNIVKTPHREAIICEGQIDVIRCHACGFPTAVASEGTAFTKEHVTLLKKTADSVTLLFDADAAGKKAALRTGALFLAEDIPVRVASLPPGEDPDSFLRDKGAAAFREVLDNAISITAFQVDALRSAEKDPGTIDAVSRITKAVLEMISNCSGSVTRAHLLQEASERLHIPLIALQEDFEKAREEAKKRAELVERFRKSEPAAKTEQDKPETEMAESEEGNLAVLDEAAATPRPQPPPRSEYQLCELLAEFEHDPDVVGMVKTYLPLHLLSHPLSKGFIDAILQEQETGEDMLSAFIASSPEEWKPFLGDLIANDAKMMSAREFSKQEAAQLLIRAVWVEAYRRKRGALAADDHSPESVQENFRLSILIKKLQTLPWERLEAILNPDGVRAVSAPAVEPSPVPVADSVVPIQDPVPHRETPDDGYEEENEISPDEFLG
ncbi:MAG: DNA primase [Kiritimatiellae bacterium]|nr:DNA primase [Kiritimatiellia bacterium]